MTEECIKHVDKKFLLHIIRDLKDSVEMNVENGGKYLVDDEDVIKETLKQARKVLGEDNEL